MIRTKLISVPKKGDGGGTTIIRTGRTSTSGGSGSKFEPHYLWGQYFDDTEDIEGDLKNVDNIYANGNITAEGTIEGDTIKANTLDVTDGLNVDLVTTNSIKTKLVDTEKTSTEQLFIGDKDKGQWIIDEDENVNLNVHINQNKTFSVKPNDEDIFNVSTDKVKVSRRLDLTNSQTGSSILLGTANTENKNTDIKSIVEEGFYFTDKNNNVAIGISHNYVMCGADIGSPNFFAGSSGWRVQPDGTAEFQNLKVDGNLDVYVITYNEMRATNGIMLVTDVGCITGAIENTIGNDTYWIFTISEFPPFAVDDYVLLQYKVDATRIFSFKGIVTAIDQDGTNTVRVLPLSGFEGEGTSTDDRGVTTFRTVDPDSTEGQYLIRIGNRTDANRQTIIKLNPYDGGYIDFMKGLDSPSKLASEDSIQGRLPTACRIGNMSGITYKGTTLQGYGLFSDNAYLTGAIKNLQDKWALNADGSGQVANGHIEWDASGNLTIKIGDTELTQYITTITDALDSKITTTKTQLEASITATAEALTSDYTEKIDTVEDTLDGKITTTREELEGIITQTAESLTSDYTDKITQTESDLNGVISSTKTELEGKITQSATSLTSDYTSKINTMGDTLDGKITSAKTELEGKITQSASALTSDYTSLIESATEDMDGKLTTAKQELSSNITQTAGAISTRVTAIENDYVTSSQLQQTADSISARVGNFEVGARNLIKGSRYFTTTGTNLTIKNGSFSTDSDGCKVLYYDNTSGSENKDMVEWENIKIEPGTYYTLSFWAKGSGSVASFFYHPGGGCMASATNKEGNTGDGSDGYITTRLSSTAKRYWVTWKTKNSVEGSERLLPMRVSTGSSAYLWGCKLERGNTATDWSPAPEDNDFDYATSSQLTMTANNIELSVKDNIESDLRNTGINITSGTIFLDADNAEFSGEIKLRKSSDVISVYDNNGSKVININNNAISSEPTKTKQYYSLPGILAYNSQLTSADFHYQNSYTSFEIGDFTTSDTFTFEPGDIEVGLYSTLAYEYGSYSFPSYNYNDGGTYSMTVKFWQYNSSNNKVYLWQETVNNARRLTTKTISPQYNGKVYMDLSLDFLPLESKIRQYGFYGIVGDYVPFTITKYPKNLTTIGRNGLSVINNADAYMSFTDEGLKIGAGDYVLVANNTDGLAYNTKGYLNTGSSWNTPIGCPIYNNIWDESMMKDCVINSEDGTSAITVKGYEVDTKVVNMIHITGKTANNLNWRGDTNYWIILPYAESTMVYIKNSSDKDMRIYSRGVSSGSSSTYYSKNIYINQEVGTRNTGRYYFELEAHNTETLILYATRNGWFNIRPIG